jgi:hypothetical protein
MLKKKADIIKKQCRSSEALDKFIKNAAATAADTASTPKKQAGKIGRPASSESLIKVGLSLPESLVTEVDRFAAERYGRNRSLTISELLVAALKGGTK